MQVGDTPSGNPIAKPGLNEIVPVGKPYAITWQPTTTGCTKVDLVLLRGPAENIKPLYAIVEGASNTGSFSWTPASDLEPDTTHYGIQLICDESGAYQYTTQFGISNPGYGHEATSTSTKPVEYASTSSSSYKIYVPPSSYAVPGNATTYCPTGTVSSIKPPVTSKPPVTYPVGPTGGSTPPPPPPVSSVSPYTGGAAMATAAANLLGIAAVALFAI